MFGSLAGIAKDIRVEILEIYWILLIPLVLLLVIMESLKGSGNTVDVFDILRRVVVSMIMLFSLDYTIHMIGMVGDGVIGKIDKIANVWEVLTHLGPKEKDLSGGLFDLRGHILYIFSLISYIVALLGFFVAEALTHFVWVVLFTISPLMILAYVPKSTSHITVNLYKGLIKVVIWKILWTVLGVLLLKLAMSPQFHSMEDFIMSIVLNLCIGLSMLFIPIATRSLINDGLESAASALASAPAMATVTAAKFYAQKFAKQGMIHTLGAGQSLGQFMAKPLSRTLLAKPMVGPWMRPLANRMERMAKKTNPNRGVSANFNMSTPANINASAEERAQLQTHVTKQEGIERKQPPPPYIDKGRPQE